MIPQRSAIRLFFALGFFIIIIRADLDNLYLLERRVDYLDTISGA